MEEEDCILSDALYIIWVLGMQLCNLILDINLSMRKLSYRKRFKN